MSWNVLPKELQLKIMRDLLDSCTDQMQTFVGDATGQRLARLIDWLLTLTSTGPSVNDLICIDQLHIITDAINVAIKGDHEALILGDMGVVVGKAVIETGRLHHCTCVTLGSIMDNADPLPIDQVPETTTDL